MAVLRVLQGPTQGKIYSLERDTMVLGRHPNCDIVLEVGAVSREHARVVKVDENFFLEDLKSRNGTFLNNEQLEGRRKLNEKDQIRICDLVLVFNHGTPEVTVDNADHGFAPGAEVLLMTRPEEVFVRPGTGTRPDNSIGGTVTFVRDIGATIEILVDCDGTEVVSVLTPKDWPEVEVGQPVWVEMPPAACNVLGREG